MKHNTMEDYRVNGFYKGTKTSDRWSMGKQYYFRDGYTVDDNGIKSPRGEPLRYGGRFDEMWLNRWGLVPATDKMDIFDRINEASVNCVTAPFEHCDEKCPYWRTPECKDQMISDFKALRENRKEQVHEAMPIQGGFVYPNKQMDAKSVIVGCVCRSKKLLEVYTVRNVGVRTDGKGFRIDLEGIDTRYKMMTYVANADEFYEEFEPWDDNKDGGTFCFVALEDLSSEDITRLFLKGCMYHVVNGRASATIYAGGDMRFRNFDEAATYFGSDKLILVNGQGPLDDPTDGQYTGFAVATETCGAILTKGKVYRFVHGVVKLDNGSTVLFNYQGFGSYFKPIVNLHQPTEDSCEGGQER